MSKGQEIMRSFIGRMIFEYEECVSVSKFLKELSFEFDNLSDNDKLEVRNTLFGEEGL